MQLKLLILLLLASFHLTAQEPTNSDARKIDPNGLQTNQNRYGVDYEIYDYDFTSLGNSIIDRLDLVPIENVRHDSEDRLYLDENNNVLILVYSRARVHENDPPLNK